jgi:hypothetical protein
MLNTKNAIASAELRWEHKRATRNPNPAKTDNAEKVKK